MKKTIPTMLIATVAAGAFWVSNITAATPCIITLFGQQYDITSLQTTHSGGNVFQCGTDMTTTYQNQHGTNLSRMQPYLIVAPTPTPTPSPSPTLTPTPTPTVTPSPVPPDYEDDDEDEDEENDDNDDNDRDESRDKRDRDKERKKLNDRRRIIEERRRNIREWLNEKRRLIIRLQQQVELVLDNLQISK